MDAFKERSALLAGGVAAVLASACCVGPLVLLALGATGAWIGNLAALAPYRPLFIGAAVLALALAWRGLRPGTAACRPADVCASRRAGAAFRAAFFAVAALVLLAVVFPYAAPLFY